MRSFPALAALVCFALAGAPLPAAAADLPLTVGVFPTEGAAEAFFAIDQGFFKEAGLAVTLTTIPSASAIAAAAIGGSIDIGYGSAAPLASAHSRGINFRVVAPAVVYDGPPGIQAIAVAKTSAVKTAADLNGATIGVNGLREFSEFVALAWLEKNGADLKTIKVTEIPFAEMPSALRAGRVAAVAIAEPYASAARDDIRVIGDPLAAIGKHFTMTCWFATQAWLDKNPDAARRFQVAIRKSAVWANAHKAESAAIIAKYTKLTADQLATMTRSIYGENVPQAASVQPVVDVAVKYGNLAPIKAEDLVWVAP